MPIEEETVNSLADILDIAANSTERSIFRGENANYITLLPSIGRAFIKRFGDPKSKTSIEIYNWEIEMYAMFRRYCEPYMSFTPERDETRANIIGHHYGLPTRFLDWTENV
ncbi:MAG: FRG domain-containing protein [Calditrichota bacterium]